MINRGYGGRDSGNQNQRAMAEEVANVETFGPGSPRTRVGAIHNSSSDINRVQNAVVTLLGENRE